uniref:RNase H type-1 domain-containing protein n=1 Tax=Manihot esculenta TaxID=3983 RepID=A0A2C9V8R2_MANES
MDGQQWNIIFPLGIWYLWKRRNKVIFESPEQNPPMSKHFIVQQALENTEAWIFASGVDHTISRSSTTFISWSPPTMGWIAINTDGAVKGCPGPAGCAGVFRDSNGDWILGYQSALGTCTAIEAELWGILLGFRTAWDRGWKFVLDGAGRIRNLVSQITTLASYAWEVYFKHIFREANTMADCLAKSSVGGPLGM